MSLKWKPFARIDSVVDSDADTEILSDDEGIQGLGVS